MENVYSVLSFNSGKKKLVRGEYNNIAKIYKYANYEISRAENFNDEDVLIVISDNIVNEFETLGEQIDLLNKQLTEKNVQLSFLLQKIF